MSGSDFGQPGSSYQNATETIESGGHPDEMKLEPLILAEKLSSEISRFSSLSSELMEVLSGLSREVRISAEQLNRIRAEVDARKKELKTLHGIEATASALERLVLDHQRQKEALDRIIADQRALWEKERANRAQEDKEYFENLKVRREREEESYRQRWAAERLKAQQKLEEELRVIQQESLQKQQALERDCLERELRLKEKELEWVQLIQELEQFMSKLTRRTQSPSNASPDVGSAKGPESTDFSGEPKSPVSSLKEMLVTQGQRIEHLKS